MKTMFFKFLPLVILASIAVVGFSGQDASAYTCSKSGDNGSNKIGDNELEYINGSCVFYTPDSMDNDKRDPIIGTDGKISGYECSDGAVLHDDNNCWNYRPNYTNAKPTYDDGSQVPVEIWQNMCSDIDEGWSQGHHYQESRHRCESSAGCEGLDDYSIKEGGFSFEGNPFTAGECLQLGNGSLPPPDPTTPENDPDNPENEDPAEGICDENNKSRSSGCDNRVNETCGNARVNLIVCDGDSGTPSSEIFGDLLRIAVFTLTMLIGIASVGGLAWASVQYAKAEDDSGKVSEARGLIRNIVIGLVLYAFLVGIMNMLIPGGVIAP